jgi:hypothetical protein
LEEAAKDLGKSIDLNDEPAIPTILAPEGVVVRDTTPATAKSEEGPESHQEQSA